MYSGGHVHLAAVHVAGQAMLGRQEISLPALFISSMASSDVGADRAIEADDVGAGAVEALGDGARLVAVDRAAIGTDGHLGNDRKRTDVADGGDTLLNLAMLRTTEDEEVDAIA